MGANARYRFWTHENWRGYAPTIGAMRGRNWQLTLHCQTCRFASRVDYDRVIRLRGSEWSPWAKTAKCPALHCSGRMGMRAYDPRSNETISISFNHVL